MSRTRDLGKIISGNFDVPATALDNAATAVNTNVSTLAVTRSNISDLGTGALSNRNLIINGDMRIAQRGTSFTSSGSGLFTLDRWVSGVHTGTGDGNMTQETDAPTAIQSGTAFTHSLKFQVTTANTNIQATDRKYHVYRIEGQDLAPAGFGQAGQRYMTLSFWHKHTKTGTHSLAINNAARNRSYPMEYTQATTNTWEKAELTFPVDTTGTWLGGNGIGMWIFFGAAFGSNYAGTVNQWGSSQKYGTANQVNNYDSTSNSMQFTGVQLELGDTATPFEHRSYGDELARCQRYYSVIKTVSAHPVWVYSSTGWSTTFPHPTTMRAVPSVSFTGVPVNGSGLGSSNGKFSTYSNNSWRGLTSITASQVSSSVDMSRIDGVTNDSMTPGHSAGLYMGSNCSINMDAEM
jgi:hypothetical protein